MLQACVLELACCEFFSAFNSRCDHVVFACARMPPFQEAMSAINSCRLHAQPVLMRMHHDMCANKKIPWCIFVYSKLYGRGHVIPFSKQSFGQWCVQELGYFFGAIALLLSRLLEHLV